jgi:hypothetical protein
MPDTTKGRGVHDDAVGVTLLVDGMPLHQSTWVDLKALEKSASGSGEYWIFSCACGEPACAGIYNGVVVLHAAESVTWLVPEPLREWLEDATAPDVPPEGVRIFKEIEFDRHAYLRAISTGVGRIESIGVPPNTSCMDSCRK